MTKQRARRRAWEWCRGYYSHHLWSGRDKLATIRLDRVQRIYRWQAGTQCGEAADLGRAKAAVEAALRMQAHQLTLFNAGAAGWGEARHDAGQGRAWVANPTYRTISEEEGDFVVSLPHRATASRIDATRVTLNSVGKRRRSDD